MPITQRFMHITWFIRIYFELCASNAIMLKHLVMLKAASSFTRIFFLSISFLRISRNSIDRKLYILQTVSNKISVADRVS